MRKQEREGFEAGQAAGSWVFDGNTTRETYAAILKGIEDGDPMILDQLPQAPDGCSLTYQLAFGRGVESEVVTTARNMLAD